MLPIFLVQALIGLGGLCFILCITIFHYFKDKVDKHILQEVQEAFSSSYTDEFIQKLREGKIPLIVIKNFSKSIFDISLPRRRMQSLLLFFPVAGCLAIISAIFGSFNLIDNPLFSEFVTIFDYVANTLLLLMILIIVYCAIQLIRLTKELV